MPVAGSTVGLVTAVCSKLVIYVIYVCMRYLTLSPSLRLSFWYTKSYWLGAKCSQMQREKEEGKTSRSALFAAINRVKTAPTKKKIKSFSVLVSFVVVVVALFICSSIREKAFDVQPLSN